MEKKKVGKMVTSISLLDFMPKERMEKKVESKMINKSNPDHNSTTLKINEDILYLLKTLDFQNPKEKNTQQQILTSYLDSNSRSKKRRKRKRSKNMNCYEFKLSDLNLIIPLPNTKFDREKLLYAIEDLRDGIRKEKIPEAIGNIGSCYGCKKYRKNSYGLYDCDIIHYLYLAYTMSKYIKDTEEAYKAIKAWAYHRIRQHNCVKKREAFIEYLDRMGCF